MSDPESEIQRPWPILPARVAECECTDPGRGGCACDDDGTEIGVDHQAQDHRSGGFPRRAHRAVR